MKFRISSLQFPLVGACLCLGGCATPDGYYANYNHVKVDPAQEESIMALTKLGGTVQFVSEEYLHVSLSETRVTDTGLAHLERLPGVTDLFLYDTKITDAGLVHLEGLTRLEHLYLSHTKITGPGLVHVAGLTKLRTLKLGSNYLTDAGLPHLKGLNRLELLDLDYGDFTDAGLASLKGNDKRGQTLSR